MTHPLLRLTAINYLIHVGVEEKKGVYIPKNVCKSVDSDSPVISEVLSDALSSFGWMDGRLFGLFN